MKKSLSLIAILGLLLMVSNVFAVAPIFNDIPDLKFYVSQGLSSAFDLAQYNTGDAATSYSIIANGLNLATLTGSVVGQDPYSSVTVTANTFEGSNAGGSTQVSNKAKYATYKIQKLPKVGLNVGSSYTVGVGALTIPSIPASFGNQDAIVVSDVSKVTAYWSGNNVVVQSIAAASGPVYVDVIASDDTVAWGIDQDKERIEVTNNLVTGINFATSADTANFGQELAPGKSTLAGIAYAATVNDGAGAASDGGVMQFVAADINGGIKETLVASKWINVNGGSWYKARAKVAASATFSGEQFILFAYNGDPSAAGHTDVAANASFGIPTTWTWLEANVYAATTATAKGYLQFQFKAGGAQTLNVDELQIVQSAPTLVDASRLATRLFYSYGDFDVDADTTGWGQENYAGAVGGPGVITRSNDNLVLDFTGATDPSKKGIKWTANNGGLPGTVYTPVAIAGREVGMRVDFTLGSGANSTKPLALAAAYGVQSNGSVTIATQGSNLIAAAQIGPLVPGSLRTAGNAVNGFYQFQFGFRSDATAVINVGGVDYDSDRDDPNYGDGSLYPL